MSHKTADGMANSAEPNQTVPQEPSGQGLHCFAQTLSGCLGLLRKGKTWIIAKFHRANLLICSHSREGQTQSYSQRNTVVELKIREYCMTTIVCFFSFL